MFGRGLLVVETRITDAQRRLAERPAVRQLRIQAVILLVDAIVIGIVADQIAGRSRPVDRGGIVIFEAALAFETGVAKSEDADPVIEHGGAAGRDRGWQ